MDNLVVELYVLSIMACCVCLWLWYEIENWKDYVTQLRYRIVELDQRVQEVERKRR